MSKTLMRSCIYLPITLFLVICSVSAYTYITTPKVSALKKCMTTSMNHVYLCPKSPSYVSLQDVSQILKDAIIVAEDASFYGHSGFDWFEIRQSFFRNFREGRFVRGASTITQQLAKNIFLSPQKTLSRKIQEAWLTFQLETNYSKNFIFEKYLNVVELGPQLYGVKDASAYYFSKPPAELNVFEAVFLAHLLPNPIESSKAFDNGLLDSENIRRMTWILEALKRFNKISPEEYNVTKVVISNFES